MITDLQLSAEKELLEMATLLRDFTQETANIKPAPGSWTAAEVAEHIRISVSGSVELMNGKTGPANRPTDVLVQPLADVFLNFDTKLESPDFVLPEIKVYDKAALTDALLELKEQVSEIIRTKPMEELCLDFEFPMMGHLTRLETAHFIIFHTRRHNGQIRRVAKALKEQKQMA